MELTGAKEDDAREKKFALKHCFIDTMIPRMEELCREHNAIIRYQADGAGERTMRLDLHLHP